MKYEFASPQWWAALHGVRAQAALAGFAQSPDYRVSICEVLFNVPPERGGDANGEMAWSIVSDGPNVDFQLCERDDIEHKVRADFAFAAAAARLDTSDPVQKAELERLRDEARAAGKIEVVKTPPQGIVSVHNLMVRLTA